MKDNTMIFDQEVSYFAIKKLQLKLSYEGKQSHLWSELAKESQPSKLKLYNLQSRVSRCIFSQITALHLCDCNAQLHRFQCSAKIRFIFHWDCSDCWEDCCVHTASAMQSFQMIQIQLMTKSLQMLTSKIVKKFLLQKFVTNVDF